MYFQTQETSKDYAVQVYNESLFLLEHLSQDKKALSLFRQVAFLVHRNTYGGLTKHDTEALFNLKKELSKLLDEPEKKYITKLIDSFSIYDLPENLVDKSQGKNVKLELYDFISKQDYKELCNILTNYLPPNNSIYLKIRNHPDSLPLVKDLVKLTKEEAPDKITQIKLDTCSVWEKIRNVDDLEYGYIHIAFKKQDLNGANFLCHKALRIAEKYLESIQPEEKPEPQRQRATTKREFKPNIMQGIVSFTKKMIGGNLESDINLSDKALKKDEKIQAKNKNKEVKKVVGELVTKELEDELSQKRKPTDLIGNGFFDVEQGFLFCIN